MSFFRKYLNEHKLTICFCTVLLVIQAVFSLYLPYFMGKLIGVGIQQKGIECDAPEFLTENAIELFKLVFPSEEEQEFISQYSFSDVDGIYILNANANPERVNELYENGIMTGFIIALQKNNEKVSDMSTDQINSFIDIVNIDMIYKNVKKLSDFSEKKVAEIFAESAYAPKAIKGQLAAFAAPYFYEDAGIDCEETQNKYIIKMSISMFICAVLQIICIIFTGRFAAEVSSHISGKIREDFILHTSEFSMTQQIQCDGDLFSVFSADINNVGLVVNYFMTAFLYAPIINVGGTILSFMISPSLSLIVLSTVLIVMVILLLMFKVALPRYETLQNKYSLLVRFAKSGIEQLYTIRTMRTGAYEKQRFINVADDVRKDERYVLRSIFTALSIVSLISNLIAAVAVIVLGNSLLSSTIGIGDIIAFLQYCVITVSAFTTLTATFLFAPRAKVSFERIYRIMKISLPEKSSAEGFVLNELGGHTVEFRNISLREANGKGLKNVSFIAEKDKITAIVGPTGCGKTTLLGILTGNVEKINGQVYIDSTDIDSISSDSLRNRVSYAFSEPVVFSKSLNDNLAMYGADDDGCVDRALNFASVDFIEDRNQVIENSGNHFSGGQRGRIALAGALSKKAGIYIIDDCLRSVDADTEEKILAHLKELSSDATVILVSQRINSLTCADKIVVLSETGVEAQGTHDELLRVSQFYKELAALQGVEVAGDE